MASTRRTSGKAAERALSKWGNCTGQSELFSRKDLSKATPAVIKKDKK